MSQDSFALAALMELLAELKAAKMRIAELEALASAQPAASDGNVVVLDKE